MWSYHVMQQLPLAIKYKTVNYCVSVRRFQWTIYALFVRIDVGELCRIKYFQELISYFVGSSLFPRITDATDNKRISPTQRATVALRQQTNRRSAQRHPNMNSTIGANCITKRFGRKTQIIAVTALLCTLCDCEVWAQIGLFCCIVFAWGSRRWCFATLSLVVCRQAMKMTRWTPPMRDNNAYLSAKLSSFDTTVVWLRCGGRRRKASGRNKRSEMIVRTRVGGWIELNKIPWHSMWTSSEYILCGAVIRLRWWLGVATVVECI